MRDCNPGCASAARFEEQQLELAVHAHSFGRQYCESVLWYVRVSGSVSAMGMVLVVT